MAVQGMSEFQEDRRDCWGAFENDKSGGCTGCARRARRSRGAEAGLYFLSFRFRATSLELRDVRGSRVDCVKKSGTCSCHCAYC